ncbi:MAG: uroporphyrinogen-III synthase [Candidatus Liberibacter europaeus]|uniref:Uroporphyrinogen-III synthase n=1 Tax=Candidatus Liberibacter europaeus TaxID=744859 RepID=A0A2T4VWA8_9HYPH|nr:uroporphyrinogen-III synthase [Candidatus Liberibacter europaeus]PTL86062.1 MAG: uroporphyrinogen-III synthase [Candidatus Liberibacter europaeus]
MRIVVTRPKEKVIRTSEKLKEMNHIPIMMPLSYFTYKKESVFLACKKPYSAIAITSSESLNVLPPDISRQTIIFAVGKESASLAKKKGFYNTFHGTSNSVDLAQKIIQQRSLFTSEKPLLYLGGKPRSSDFENHLIKHNIPVKIIDCYNNCGIVYSRDEIKIKLRNADAVLFYAKSAVSYFFLLPLPKNMAVNFFCLSQSIAAEIPELYRKNVYISHFPEEHSLLKLLI